MTGNDSCHVCWCLNKCRSNKKSEEKTVTSVTQRIFRLYSRWTLILHQQWPSRENENIREKISPVGISSTHTKSEGNNKETGDIFTNRKKTKNSSPLL
jgi:hypothetical protein